MKISKSVSSKLILPRNSGSDSRRRAAAKAELYACVSLSSIEPSSGVRRFVERSEPSFAVVKTVPGHVSDEHDSRTGGNVGIIGYIDQGLGKYLLLNPAMEDRDQVRPMHLG